MRTPIEMLESRRLLSVTVAESEPNTGAAAANPVPRVLDEPVHFTGAIDAPGDLDWLKIELQKGDIFGASLRGAPGLDGMIHVGNDSALLIHNDDSFFTGAGLPAASPMPQYADDIRDPEVYYVISAPGTYYLQVSAYTDPDTGQTSTGAYDLKIVVARPGMESKPVGAKQILFLDFDGGEVPFDNGNYVPHLAPLSTTLSQWGLGASDLNKVIRETVKRTTEKLDSFIAANGLNGDYATSHTPGDFGIDIRNSLEDPDAGNNPLASRIIVGPTDDAQLANVFVGLAQHIDVGNFQQDDQAVCSTNFIAGLLAGFPIAKPENKSMVIDFVTEYMSVLVSHEFGHLAGAFHMQFTVENSFNEPVTLMDKDIRVPMGPDLVFGTADDIVMHFGVDAYDPNEIYVGIDDTLNTVAFGLSTGRGAAISSAARSVGSSMLAASSTRSIKGDNEAGTSHVISLIEFTSDQSSVSLIL